MANFGAVAASSSLCAIKTRLESRRIVILRIDHDGEGAILSLIAGATFTSSASNKSATPWPRNDKSRAIHPISVAPNAE
jgi:hypothetical protein